MIFGPTPLAEAAGAILAHSLKHNGLAFKKGRRLSEEDVSKLSAAGLTEVIAARLEPGDVHEDSAADTLAQALLGDAALGLTATAAFTGRSNLVVDRRGLLVLDRDRLDALNLIDEAVTVASLPPFEPVEPRQMAATIKVIPFAVPGEILKRCLAITAAAEAPLLRVAALRPRQIGLVQTRLPGMKASLLDKTRDSANQRLHALDCPDAIERRCDHEEAAVAQALQELAAQGCELILLSGASAIVDRRDVLPAGLERAGGQVRHFGMPVDPGNLILLGERDDKPVIGLPGCARSPKLNGFDWVLQRLLCDLPVTREDVMRMGAGGLLKEIASRPLPRAEAASRAADQALSPRAPKIGAILLAAGQSRRMGPVNKLLAQVGGEPMVVRANQALRASQASPVVVVTGHEHERVEAALASVHADRVRFVHNPDFAAGLSGSLQRGLAALPEDLDGVVICLGDMPRVTSAVVDRLIAAFNPLEGRAICLPTWQGKRGNPVLFAKRFFAELQTIGGDVGGRALIGDYPEAVCEVPMADDSILLDVDTPDALLELQRSG